MRHPSHEPSNLIAFRNFNEEMKHPGVWETDQGAASTAENSRDNLASLYRPPFHLMLHGSFEKVTGSFLLELIFNRRVMILLQLFLVNYSLEQKRLCSCRQKLLLLPRINGFWLTCSLLRSSARIWCVSNYVVYLSKNFFLLTCRLSFDFNILVSEA